MRTVRFRRIRGAGGDLHVHAQTLGVIDKSALPDVICGKYVEGRGVDLFNAVCEHNLEGVVAKRKTGTYATVSGWLKIKNPNYSQSEPRHELMGIEPMSEGWEDLAGINIRKNERPPSSNSEPKEVYKEARADAGPGCHENVTQRAENGGKKAANKNEGRRK